MRLEYLQFLYDMLFGVLEVCLSRLNATLSRSCIIIITIIIVLSVLCNQSIFRNFLVCIMSCKKFCQLQYLIYFFKKRFVFFYI